MKDNHKADVSHTDEFDRMYQEMVKQAEDKYKVKSEHPKTEEGIGLIDELSSKWVNEFKLPNGYIFKDENGNVINARKIVLEKKKKEYPKTYEECCRIIGFCSDILKWDNSFSINRDTHPYIKHLDNLLESFYKLLICRDAFWKIAGDEMGLGKPWDSKYGCGEWGYWIGYDINENKIYCQDSRILLNRLLVFPTAEMRDAFYENFKSEIESCKELL